MKNHCAKSGAVLVVCRQGVALARTQTGPGVREKETRGHRRNPLEQPGNTRWPYPPVWCGKGIWRGPLEKATKNAGGEQLEITAFTDLATESRSYGPDHRTFGRCAKTCSVPMALGAKRAGLWTSEHPKPPKADPSPRPQCWPSHIADQGYDHHGEPPPWPDSSKALRKPTLRRLVRADGHNNILHDRSTTHLATLHAYEERRAASSEGAARSAASAEEKGKISVKKSDSQKMRGVHSGAFSAV